MFKVVIIENERLVRKGLTLTIDWEEMNAMVVGEAATGQDGIDIIIKTNPDIVITDIKMPEMDGLQMIEVLQEKNIPTEYIIISGYDEFEYAQSAMRLGVVDFLLKPINEGELRKSLLKIQERIKTDKRHDKLIHKISNIDNSPYILFEKYFEERHFDSQEEIISKTINFIILHFNSDLTINKISNHLQVSSGHLSRSFKKVTGYTILEYITLTRIKKAIDLFEKNHYRISEVAYTVGFNDPKYFSNTFRRYVGVTPTEFRNRLN